MRVLVTGATGFVGRALVARLAEQGHEPIAWTRSLEPARALLGSKVEIVESSGGLFALETVVAGVDGVVNLAGETIGGVRWTPAVKEEILKSRLEITKAVAKALRAAPRRSRVLVSASGVDYYGDTGDAIVDESAPAGRGFLADVCIAWEKAAHAAEGDATRVTIGRFGLVLGRGGGALAKMLGPFRMGVGGPIGNGRQWLSWIHLDDLVSALTAALGDARWTGAWNAVSSEPVTSRDFAKTLGRVLGRPAFLPTPAFALKLMFGEGASILFDSHRLRPAKLEERGLAYRHPTLDGALRESV
jgi:hypothetical protein